MRVLHQHGSNQLTPFFQRSWQVLRFGKLTEETFLVATQMNSKLQANVSSIVDQVSNEIADTLTFPEISRRAAPVPEFDSLVDMLQRLRAIVYPRFRSSESSREEATSELKRKLAEVYDILAKQIAIAVARHIESCQDMANLKCGFVLPTCEETQAGQNNEDLGSIADRSHELAAQYISKLPAIRKSLMTDMEAAFLGDPACKNFDEVILCYPGLNAVTIYRLAHELNKLNVPFLPRMMTEWAHGETGVDIHPGAKIGDHFFIDHGTGVVIGETCEIGQHVKIYQGVTLGALSFPQDESGQLIRNSKRHPTIGDHVVIYANATVLGGDTVIGHDSVVGSSVWLTHSVDPHTTVIMEKPKLRLRNQVDN